MVVNSRTSITHSLKYAVNIIIRDALRRTPQKWSTHK